MIQTEDNLETNSFSVWEVSFLSRNILLRDMDSFKVGNFGLTLMIRVSLSSSRFRSHLGDVCRAHTTACSIHGMHVSACVRKCVPLGVYIN